MLQVNFKRKAVNGKIFAVLAALILFSQLSPLQVYAKIKQPTVNPQEKINYVNICWWENFSDPCLKYYIKQAILNNHDARKASWKVEEYKQLVRIQFAKELPALPAGTDYIGNHLPDSFVSTKTSIFAVTFFPSYEADIFLRNHDKTKSAKKACEATKFQEKAIYIALASDVATTYINLIKFEKQIELQQELIEVKREELQRQEARYKRGVVSVPELNNFKKDYETAQSNLDEIIKSRDKALNQLAVLIGESPCNICALNRGKWDNLEYTCEIPGEIPSDAVFSRPDIMEAEADLEKSKIDVRVARKELLPRFNIIGLYSFTNVGASGFGTWGSTIAAIIAGATVDLFKGGEKIADLKRYKTLYEQMFQAYMQTNLNAIKEVNNSMLIIKEDTKIDQNTNTNLQIQEDNYQRALRSYKNGVISYTELLSEQENFLNMKQNQVNTKTSLLVDYITLYKAVGGNL